MPIVMQEEKVVVAVGSTLEEAGEFAVQNGVASKLIGHELSYESWLSTYAPHAASSKLGDHHHRAWQWAEKLEPGFTPPALIECWFRGGGKSTTMELIVSRLAVKATRRFVVYVCATQDMADRHVQDIATAM